MQNRSYILSNTPLALLNLHRTYFAQALHEQPHDLLKHRYGPSVVATYRSAWRLIEGLKLPSRKSPNLLSRYSLAWSQVLSAAVSSYFHNGAMTFNQMLCLLDCNVSPCDSSAVFESSCLLLGRVGYGRAVFYTGCSEQPSSIK